MAHKTFISYKYSESFKLRDKIINALGGDATYYKGERSNSKNMTYYSDITIKESLKNMIYDTSVTIVIISPNMLESEWIGWEIEYSLKKIQRSNIVSKSNGIIGVIMKYNGDYSWFQSPIKYNGCCKTIYYEENKVHDIISKNRFVQFPTKYICEKCKTIDPLTGVYISYVTEEDFINDPTTYINNAYIKSENDAAGYKLVKQI